MNVKDLEKEIEELRNLKVKGNLTFRGVGEFYMVERWLADKKEMENETEALLERVQDGELRMHDKIKSLETDNKELLRQCETARKIAEDRGDVVEALGKEKSVLEREIERLKEMVTNYVNELQAVSDNRDYIRKNTLTPGEAKGIIENYQNSYPKDIFMWNNKEKLDFNRGRFNRHCHEIVENMRQDLLKEVKEAFERKRDGGRDERKYKKQISD